MNQNIHQNTYPHDLTGQWQVACHEIMTPDGWQEYPVHAPKECIWEFCPNGILIKQYGNRTLTATKFYYSADKLLTIDRSEYDVDGSLDRLVEDRYRIGFSGDDCCILTMPESAGYTIRLVMKRMINNIFNNMFIFTQSCNYNSFLLRFAAWYNINT